jgi:hypothetical protein
VISRCDRMVFEFTPTYVNSGKGISVWTSFLGL